MMVLNLDEGKTMSFGKDLNSRELRPIRKLQTLQNCQNIKDS